MKLLHLIYMAVASFTGALYFRSSNYIFTIVISTSIIWCIISYINLERIEKIEKKE